MILIIIKFGETLFWISWRIINALRSYINHLKECFIRYQNTSKLIKKTWLRLVFSTHFSVFGYLMNHSSLCLKYYLQDHSKHETIKHSMASKRLNIVNSLRNVHSSTWRVEEKYEIFHQKIDSKIVPC